MKGEIIATAKCRECGGVMEGRKSEYRYVESGLNSVNLKNILVFHCTKCNDIVPEIPAAGVLHRIIAVRLLKKKTLLAGSELRFLRKLCGYSVDEFCEVMGSSRSVVSRWETQNTFGEKIDRTVRLLAVAKFVREICGQPDAFLKNVTVEQLSQEVETALKEMQARRLRKEQYEIDHEEIARLGGIPEAATAAPMHM
jgi:transcriptional regulator with XRE-family HTH domain